MQGPTCLYDKIGYLKPDSFHKQTCIIELADKIPGIFSNIVIGIQ